MPSSFSIKTGRDVDVFLDSSLLSCELVVVLLLTFHVFLCDFDLLWVSPLACFFGRNHHTANDSAMKKSQVESKQSKRALRLSELPPTFCQRLREVSLEPKRRKTTILFQLDGRLRCEQGRKEKKHCGKC